MANYIVYAPNGRHVTMNIGGYVDMEYKHGQEIILDEAIGDKFPHILKKILIEPTTAPQVLKEVPAPVKVEVKEDSPEALNEVPEKDLESSVLEEKPKAKKSYTKKS